MTRPVGHHVAVGPVGQRLGGGRFGDRNRRLEVDLRNRGLGDGGARLLGERQGGGCDREKCPDDDGCEPAPDSDASWTRSLHLVVG